jgi:hypothetical protein
MIADAPKYRIRSNSGGQNAWPLSLWTASSDTGVGLKTYAKDRRLVSDRFGAIAWKSGLGRLDLTHV